MKNIKKGFYYHFKHDPNISINNYAYEVIGISKHTEDGSLSVIYRPLYKNEWLGESEFFNRPIDMFMDTVDKPEYTGPRFRLIEDSEIISKLNDMRVEIEK